MLGIFLGEQNSGKTLAMTYFGYKYYKIFIYANKLNEENINRFLYFCKSNKNMIFLVENVGSWEFEPEFEVKNEDDFYKIINEIKNNFPQLVKNIETTRIIKEHKFVYCPVELITRVI